MQKGKFASWTQITDRYLAKLKQPSQLSGEQIWKVFKGDGSGDEVSIEFIQAYCGKQKNIQLDLAEFERLLFEENEKSLRNLKTTKADHTAFIDLANRLKSLPKTDDSFKYAFDIEQGLG